MYSNVPLVRKLGGTPVFKLGMFRCVYGLRDIYCLF